MWFNVYVINLFFWKCRAIQLNLPLPNITTSFFPIGVHGYEKANLGSMLLHTKCDDQLTKKSIFYFVKIKFHSNENIEWHCMQLQFKYIKWNSNLIALKFIWNKIELKRN
jgi:hypothetical protein